MKKNILIFLICVIFVDCNTNNIIIDKHETLYFYDVSIISKNAHPMFMNGVSKSYIVKRLSNKDLNRFVKSFYSNVECCADLYFGLRYLANYTSIISETEIDSLYISLSDDIEKKSNNYIFSLNDDTKVIIKYCIITGYFYEIEDSMLLNINECNFQKIKILYNISSVK